MATVYQLIDTILDNIEGTKRGDVSLRARLLREAGYLPTGKHGGGKGIVHVDSGHCANLIIGLIASSTARGVVAAVERFRELPLVGTAAVDIVGLTHMENTPEPATLFLAIEAVIDNWRANIRPWAADLELDDMIGYCDSPEGPVIFSFRDSAQDEEGRKVGWWLVYGARPDLPHGSRWAPMLSLSGAVLGHIVELLGPIEAAPEDAAE